jgi:Spy/CpxP family protein refolding chaperone
MIGFLVGAACLIGLLKLARMGRRRRWGYGGGCGPSHGYGGGGCGYGPGEGWGGEHGWGRHGSPFGRWFFMRHILSRIDATPEQEKVIKTAVDELRTTAAKVRADAKAARPEVANAIRQEQFDETLFGEISHKIDEAAQTMRRATVDAFAKIHAVLDERQKKLLADLVETGPSWRGFGGAGGPYRTGNGGGVSL